MNGLQNTLFHQYSGQTHGYRNIFYFVALLHSFRVDTSSKAHPVPAFVTNLDYKLYPQYNKQSINSIYTKDAPFLRAQVEVTGRNHDGFAPPWAYKKGEKLISTRLQFN